MADSEQRTIRSIQYQCSEPETKIEISNKSHLYYPSDKNGLGDYHYKAMIERLNQMDEKFENKKIGCLVGCLLRRLWQKYEKKLTVHSTRAEGGKSEQKLGGVATNIKFNVNDKGEYGVYTDLVYDTYGKKWSKAYQSTFHEFFHNIDYLANHKPEEYFSCVYKNRFFRFVEPDGLTISSFGIDNEKCQFGEVVIRDVENLSIRDGNVRRLKDKYRSELHGSSTPKHSKGYLYDIIGGVLLYSEYEDSGERDGLCGHGPGYWLEEGLEPYLWEGNFYVSKNKIKNTLEQLIELAEFANDIKSEATEHIKYFPEGKNYKDILTAKQIKALEYFAEVAAAAAIINPDADIVKKILEPFPKYLASEVLANMASAAIVNPAAFETMKKYMPNSYNMFIIIISNMLLGLGRI
jgi:hypothetical protein